MLDLALTSRCKQFSADGAGIEHHKQDHCKQAGFETFPVVGGKILGSPTTLPNALTT